MSSATSFQPVIVTTKRHRASSQSSGSSTKSGQHVVHKSTRISASPPPSSTKDTGVNETSKGSPVSTSHPLLCTLPPTCNQRPTPLANTKELESHYATYHAHVCEQSGCGCVFPDARLLELHQTENHDPLAAMRKERGDKIFACHLASCTRLFGNPKGRRLHLISAHGYPKEYFFAVTNKGVGGLLKKWGEGASMIRGKWKPRESSKADANTNNPMEVDKETFREKMDVDEDSDEDDDDDNSSGDEDDYTATRNPSIHVSGSTNTNTNTSRSSRMTIDQDPEKTPRPPVSSSLPPAATPPTTAKPLQPSTTAADLLASGFSSLSLVPPSVRFGRGGRGGFVGPGGHQKRPSQSNAANTAIAEKAVAGAGGDTKAQSSIAAEQDTAVVDQPAGRGRGGAGGQSNRGRGGSVPAGAGEGTGRGGGGARGRGARGRGRGGRGY